MLDGEHKLENAVEEPEEGQGYSIRPGVNRVIYAYTTAEVRTMRTTNPDRRTTRVCWVAAGLCVIRGAALFVLGMAHLPETFVSTDMAGIWPLLGINSCLLGAEVLRRRYHRRQLSWLLAGYAFGEGFLLFLPPLIVLTMAAYGHVFLAIDAPTPWSSVVGAAFAAISPNNAAFFSASFVFWLILAALVRWKRSAAPGRTMA